MRKLTLMLIGLIVSALAFSQNYYPFPDTNAIWNSKYNGYYGSFKERFGLYGDTAIDNQFYKKIYSIEDDTTLNLANMTYFAAIRENETKQIFVKLQTVDFEILLYDFSLNIGDTIISNSPYGYLHYDLCIIAGIDSVEVANNQYRRRFKINEWGQDYWIEGIGSIKGPFHPITEYIIGAYSDLFCLKDNDTVVYMNNPECDKCFCKLNTSVEEPVKSKENFTIYPNPAAKTIKIDFESGKGLSVIRIMNTNGKAIESITATSFPFEMNIDYLPSGIYLVQLENNNTIVNRKLIKID